MTAKLAELLIRFDVLQDRSRDSFVVFLCRARNFQRTGGTSSDLLCPGCREVLDDANRCERCGLRFAQGDRLLFLLPEPLTYIAEDYRSELCSRVPDEVL